ncbi:unnamed protein product [Oikopleura dioica]|uniref:Uncharacterized protein n=1 Tax=Oikopleura dioica TaxID=34765 RepID=E4XSM7_OIKDI|nr:unnamed protein product [Oikopleura dioica]
MSRRSLRLLQKVEDENSKSEEEIQNEIRRDLEAIREKKLLENPEAYDQFKETSEYLKELPKTPKIQAVKGNLKKYLTERKKREQFLLSSAGPKSVPRSSKLAESLPTPKARPKAAKSLKFAPTQTPQRKSSKEERKRSPIRNQGGLPPKSPFRFNPTRTESPMRRVNFGTTNNQEIFVFGKNAPDENKAPKTPTRRQARKTTYKHVIGNYNTNNCKYEKMSARDRRMAYSSLVDKRNLRKGVKELTRNRKPDKKEAAAKKREGVVERLRKV